MTAELFTVLPNFVLLKFWFKYDTITIKYFKNEPNNKESISSNRIRYINEDSKGNIWIGTSYGLNKFDKQSNKFYRYTEKDGLLNDNIYGILIDDYENIWVSTNYGISKFDVDKGVFSSFL